MWKKLNFWSKSYPNPTPFLGQYDSNHVQCGYVLVQYGHILSLHLLLHRYKVSKFQSCKKVHRLVSVSQQSKLNAFSLVYQRMSAIPFSLVQFSLESSKLNAIQFGSLLNGQFFVQFHLVQFGLAQTKCIQFGLVWPGPN